MSIMDAVTCSDKLKSEHAEVVAKLGSQYVEESRKGEVKCKACNMILLGKSLGDVREHFAWYHTDDVLKILKKEDVDRLAVALLPRLGGGSMAPARVYYVVDCEDREKWRGHWRIHASAFGRGSEGGEAEWRHCRAWAGELPSLTEPGLAGLAVTGSHHCSYDGSEAWVGALADWLRQAVRRGGIKVVAVCFGCQVLARALGGETGPREGGYVAGVESVVPAPALASRQDYAAACEAFGREPTEPLDLVEAHGDEVTALPPGAELLASSGTCRVEAWSLGDSVLAFQAHPEMSPALLSAKILGPLASSGKLALGYARRAHVRANEGSLDAGLVLATVRGFLYGVGAPAPGGKGLREEAEVGVAAAAAALGPPPSLSERELFGEAALAGQVTALFEEASRAVAAEVTMAANEYELLASLNTAARAKYEALTAEAEEAGERMQDLLEAERLLAPHMEAITEVEEQVAELEEVVGALDTEARKLELRLRAVAQRAAAAATGP